MSIKGAQGLSIGLLGLLLAACGGVSPITAGDSGAKDAPTGTAGTTGSAGTTESAGTTGAAGTTGGAGTTGVAGTTGAGGMSGRVPAKHRAAAAACAPDRAAGMCTFATPDAGVGTSACNKDSDCTGGMNGRCASGGRLPSCTCSYDKCFADSTCTTGGPCACRVDTGSTIVAPAYTSANSCLEGNCRVDHDCGAAGYCSPTLGSCGNYLGVTGYYCHTSKDKCTDDTDCATQGGGDCRYNGVTALWACETSQCAG